MYKLLYRALSVGNTKLILTCV